MRTLILAMLVLTGCWTVGYTDEQAAPQLAAHPLRPPGPTECGPSPVEPAWSASAYAGDRPHIEIPEDQWSALALYLSNVRDWRDCMVLKYQH